MILLKNARIINPIDKRDEIADILIEENRIKKISPEINEEDFETIDLKGKVLAPGFIDLHVHLREPGEEHKETVKSGLQAAVSGGFTGVCPMPNTHPVCDNESVVEMLLLRARSYGLADVYPIASITKDQNGTELTEMGLLKKSGTKAFSDDGRDVKNTLVMRRALDYAKAFNMPLFAHCEDKNLAGSGVMHEGIVASRLGLGGIPNEAENIMIGRNVMLAGLTKSRLHICHLSTKEGLDIVRDGKLKGINVTCEVTPHHFSMTHEDVGFYNTDAKVNPPLRTDEDVTAIIDAIKDGVVDTIATDHAPHTLEDKDTEFSQAAFGISGLETAVALTINNLYHENQVPIERIVELMATNPRKILGLEQIGFSEGEVADFTIIDLDREKLVDKSAFYSKGKNTPFDGMKLKGWPYMTIKNGKIIMKDGEVLV